MDASAVARRCAAILGVPGARHPACEPMPAVRPGIPRQTTIRKPWPGCHVCHRRVAIPAASVFGYLAFAPPALLSGSVVLQSIALGLLLARLVTGLRRGFRVPTGDIGPVPAFALAAVVPRPRS